MRARSKFLTSALAILGITAGLFLAPPAQALNNFRKAPSTVWGHTYAGAASGNITATRSDVSRIEGSTVFKVTYTNFPEWAKRERTAAVEEAIKAIEATTEQPELRSIQPALPKGRTKK